MDDLKPGEFSGLMLPFAADLEGRAELAVAVSGGPDSMALAFLLSQWANAQENPPFIHALIVDHGLRAESGAEAAHVAMALSGLERIRPHVLKWEHEGIARRIQEAAREARYALMAEACQSLGVSMLFLGHHRDDQAETFLLRLAGGSGLDGLCAMRPVQPYNAALSLVRPLLDVPKERLLATCTIHKLPFVLDGSNECEAFARVRLRRARGILEREGLSAARISRTVNRLSRARTALEAISEKAYLEMAVFIDTDRIVFNIEIFRSQPEEISFRCVCKALSALGRKSAYRPRFERIEALFLDLFRGDTFRKRTLGGVIIERCGGADGRGQIIFNAERRELA